MSIRNAASRGRAPFLGALVFALGVGSSLFLAAGSAIGQTGIGTTGTPPGQTNPAGNPQTPPGQAKDPGEPAQPHGRAPGPGGSRIGAPPGVRGCTGAIFTTDASGSAQNKNRYESGENVYVNGQNFPAGVSLTYSIVQVNGGGSGPSGSFGSGDGNVTAQLVWPSPSGTGHEYKVIVTFTGGNGQSCSKSDNFFFVGAEESMLSLDVGCPLRLTTRQLLAGQATRLGAFALNGDGSAAAGVTVVLRVSGSGEQRRVTDENGFVQFTVPPVRADARISVEAPGQCGAATIGVTRTASRVGAFTTNGIKIARSAQHCPGVTLTPEAIDAGERETVRVRVRLFGKPVENAVVKLRGPGVQATRTTGADGVAAFRVTAERPGLLRATVPNVTDCAKRSGVLGAIAGQALTG